MPVMQSSRLLPPLDKLRAAISNSSGSGGGQMSVDAHSYLQCVRWGDEGHYLREFVAKRQLPHAAKIIKGQHQGLGVPSLPSPNLAQVVLVASAGPKLKVIAQCVKFKDAGRRAVPVGPRLAIPEDYGGWFEILSEDGRASRCVESVSELARRSSHNKHCLVREGLRAHLSRQDDPDSPGDKTRTLAPGEVISVGEVVSGARRSGGSTGSKYLGCETSTGDTLFLPLEQRGRFSPVAGEDNISGVHTAKTLMASKRFPLMVRLVHGAAPQGLKAGGFTREMRLYSLAEEECLVAMPLRGDAGAVVPLPLAAPLKVLAPRNAEALAQTPEHAALADRCRRLAAEAAGCIQVCEGGRTAPQQYPPSPTRKHQQNHRPLVKRSVSDPQGNRTPHLERGMSTPNDSTPDSEEASSDTDDVRYDEIDQIYDYVRGFAPLPPTIKNEFCGGGEEPQKSSVLPQIGKEPPEPPPIETIPARKSSTKQQPQKITVSIVNRTPSLNTKEIYLPHHRVQKSLSQQRKSAEDHIYEKIEKKNKNAKLAKVVSDVKKTPTRSNSASKITNNNCDSNNNHTKRQSTKSRFVKNANHLAAGRHNNMSNNKVSQRRLANSKTIATSPLFHIRYKSLTDLLVDNNKKSDSSNDDQPTESASSSASTSKDDSAEDENRTRRLSRPKSLSNLIGGREPKKRLDNYYSLVQNDLIKPPPIELNKFYSMPDPSMRYAKNHYSQHGKKMGTLFL